ncbi:PREDICTED: C2 calcium-dependent domain-containing protein 4D-like [Nanorana parkeri]|uniref:C2 calcium-dependent domain-containing protein 4D-like n=1 Tax=Nanorana parkeri TaxID=125878 RepID=UPI0008542A2E|nr:PREDICTED: C2 calcium-dependent domain-containing protein 4D-like [Nanorana parkeri]
MFCSKKKLLPSCPNIITPDQIPSFFIPPKLSSLPDRGGNVGKWFQKKASDVGSKSTPRALLRSASRHVIEVEDVEQERGSPKQSHGSTMAATIMGSPYLSESPHTRRRESLFHQMCPTHGPCKLKLLSPSDPDCVLSWKASSHDLHLVAMESDTTSSTESSPFSSPLLNRCFDRRLVGQASGRQPAISRTLTVKTLTRASSLSTEETSSTDNSPNLPTKEDHGNPRASMVHLVPPPIFHLDFICCQDRLTKETEVALSKGGLIRLSVEYVKELGRLRVKLVNAENLYPLHQDPKIISCCVVMCLMPGKLQKQKSTVIRRSRNPIFNEDFYFEGIEKGELDQLRLKVKVVNRGAGVKRDILLGTNEIQISAILPQ